MKREKKKEKKEKKEKKDKKEKCEDAAAKPPLRTTNQFGYVIAVPF